MDMLTDWQRDEIDIKLQTKNYIIKSTHSIIKHYLLVIFIIQNVFFLGLLNYYFDYGMLMTCICITGGHHKFPEKKVEITSLTRWKGSKMIYTCNIFLLHDFSRLFLRIFSLMILCGIRFYLGVHFYLHYAKGK